MWGGDMRINKLTLLDDEMLTKLGWTENPDLASIIASDLARLQGVSSSSNGLCNYWINKLGNTGKRKTVGYINFTGEQGWTTSITSRMGVRFVASFDDIDDFDPEHLDDLTLDYPIKAITKNVSEVITQLFLEKSKLLIKTGRKYLIDNHEFEEYEAMGIRFINYCEAAKDDIITMDGTKISKNDHVYLEVVPVPLSYDFNARLVYCSIVPYFGEWNSHFGPLSSSDLLKKLNNQFLKSASDELEHQERTLAYPTKAITKNRYNFKYEPLSEEDIIQICIKSDIPVFVHGKTGCGKTERILALDPDLELVDFGCTSSDGFTGIIAKDFKTQKLCLYEPHWYKSLCDKSLEKPDFIHILFLEELTNASKDTQKVAFEVTLNKTLTNGGFHLVLPDNCVVVAAGNEASESRSATALSEPLFGRYAHVYIETNAENWLNWASKNHSEKRHLQYNPVDKTRPIHPAIVDFIRINGDQVLRTNYDGQVPNADPRKWALASRALYECGNPNVLRAFIGPSLTASFIAFTQLELLTVEDVLKDRVKPSDVPTEISIRWNSVFSLLNVSFDDVDKVRTFIKELGSEYLAVFDYYWSKGDNERILKLYNDNNASEQVAVKKLGTL